MRRLSERKSVGASGSYRTVPNSKHSLCPVYETERLNETDNLNVSFNGQPSTWDGQQCRLLVGALVTLGDKAILPELPLQGRSADAEHLTCPALVPPGGGEGALDEDALHLGQRGDVLGAFGPAGGEPG